MSVDENTGYERCFITYFKGVKFWSNFFLFCTRDAHIDKACKTKDLVELEIFAKFYYRIISCELLELLQDYVLILFEKVKKKKEKRERNTFNFQLDPNAKSFIDKMNILILVKLAYHGTRFFSVITPMKIT